GATLKKGGGPGTFSWCLFGKLGACTTFLDNEYRLIYRQGANRFGGVMRIGLGGKELNSFLWQLNPFRVGHAYAVSNLGPLAVGAGKNGIPSVRIRYQKAGVVTQPLVPPTTAGLILYPGPKVTTMQGLTNTMPGGKLLTLKFGTTPMGFKFARKTTSF